jgi:hypothetical protein
MLFLFQGCLRLSFKKWTGFQDLRLKNRQDFRMAGFTGLFSLGSTGCILVRISGWQDFLL